MSRTALGILLTLVVCVAEARAEPPPLSKAVAAHIREIHAAHPDLRDDAFSKMGGSSVESTAFLHCFATPYVDLGEHCELAATLDYFHAGPRSSFDRNSKAAGVSWNLRYVLGGRPANFREELGATRARWALILFGSNDAQNENERIYLHRLVYLVEELEQMGVVPILGAATPRRSSSKDRWIQRFNSITEAVAEHWSLPFIDYYSAMSALPRKGLAGDGVHPNVLSPGGLRAACQLTEKGLRYGNNVRNLLTLQMLDKLRQIIEVEPDADGGAGADAGAGTDAGADAGTVPDAATVSGAATDAGTATVPDAGTNAVTDAPTDPVTAADLPFSVLVDKSSLPTVSSLPPRCGSPISGAGLYRVRVELLEAARLRASALDLDGDKPRVFWVRIDEDGSERCVRRRNQTLEVDVPPGMWDLIVEARPRAAADGRLLILITKDPR